MSKESQGGAYRPERGYGPVTNVAEFAKSIVSDGYGPAFGTPTDKEWFVAATLHGHLQSLQELGMMELLTSFQRHHYPLGDIQYLFTRRMGEGSAQDGVISGFYVKKDKDNVQAGGVFVGFGGTSQQYDQRMRFENTIGVVDESNSPLTPATLHDISTKLLQEAHQSAGLAPAFFVPNPSGRIQYLTAWGHGGPMNHLTIRADIASKLAHIQGGPTPPPFSHDSSRTREQGYGQTQETTNHGPVSEERIQQFAEEATKDAINNLPIVKEAITNGLTPLTTPEEFTAFITTTIAEQVAKELKAQEQRTLQQPTDSAAKEVIIEADPSPAIQTDIEKIAKGDLLTKTKLQELIKNYRKPERVLKAILRILAGFIPGAQGIVAILEALNDLFGSPQ